MNFKFRNKKVTGILTVLPENEVVFVDEIENYDFSRSQSMRMKMIMGYGKRRVVKEGTTVSDLCVFGLDYLFENNFLHKNDIDAMVLVTQSPDYFVPGTSHIIHGRLDLKQDMICLDINQACSGYAIGLNQAFMLLEQEEINKVVLMNADILSSKVSIYDRNSRPLIGDGASITIVEKDETNTIIYGSVKADGKGADSIMIPAGGFKLPSNEKTATLQTDSQGNKRALDHFVMNGNDVLHFVRREVPPMIENLLNKAGCSKEEIDYYLFHQPNKFMLKKLAEQMGVSYDKMPNNIVENFGNAGGVSIPTNITYNLGERLLTESFLVCMAGFGAGYSWSSILMRLGKLNFCEIINYK